MQCTIANTIALLVDSVMVRNLIHQFRAWSLTRLSDIPLLACVWQIAKGYHLSVPNVDRGLRLHSPSAVLADSPDRGMGKGEMGARQHDCGAWDGSDTFLGNNHLVERVYHM